MRLHAAPAILLLPLLLLGDDDDGSLRWCHVAYAILELAV